ncbi:hypothetical protein [Marivita sp.]|uniref:calcium-binding protein n=1 Tax=Marivita sp. TaxID=2003365 RepID=UPI0025C1EE95|nr:hypothetical protein [Marivita sp.]
MSKPNLLELLDASGLALTFTNIKRAIDTLYGNVGANLDNRDWEKILASGNALEAAETALVEQYTDPDYLETNAAHVVGLGYSAAQVELTYRNLSDRLDVEHDRSWATGTPYERVASLSDSALQAQAQSDYIAGLPVPTLTINLTNTGISVESSLNGTFFIGNTELVNLTAETAKALEAQAMVTTGQLKVEADNGRESSLSSETITLGTTGNDTIDRSSATTQDVIHGFGGSDTIDAGDGNDTIYGGDGADTITGGAGADHIDGGIGADEFSFADIAEVTSDTLIDGGNDTDTLVITAEITAAVDLNATAGQIVNVENLTLTGGSTAAVTLDTDMTGVTLGAAGSVVLNDGAQSVTGSAGNDTVAVGDLTATGTLALAAGANVVTVRDGAVLDNATITATGGTAALTIEDNASVTLNKTNYDLFNTTGIRPSWPEAAYLGFCENMRGTKCLIDGLF